MKMIATKPTLVLTNYFGNFIILCFSLLLSQSALSADYNFKFHHFLGANSFWQMQILEPWVKRVEQNSNGQVSIEIFPSMTLGGRPPELVQQARDGVVDIEASHSGNSRCSGVKNSDKHQRPTGRGPRIFYLRYSEEADDNVRQARRTDHQRQGVHKHVERTAPHIVGVIGKAQLRYYLV